MPKEVALAVCIFFVSWLFVRDRRIRPMTSGWLWIPLIWLLIVSSRPISFWSSGQVMLQSSDAYLEGSPLDATVYFLLMIVGTAVVVSRGLDWGKMVSSNRWLIVFFLFCGVSVIWSDYPLVSFKRWIKDLGNVSMVLVLLSEKDSLQATRALFARFIYLVIPFSVLFIKYYSDLGKYFTHSGESFYCGVAVEKNGLGSLALIAGIFLLWDFIQMRSVLGKMPDLTETVSRGVLFAMTLWVLHMADSSTAFVCLVLGMSIILMVRLPFGRRQIRYLGAYCLTAGIVMVVLYSVSGVSEAVVGVMGEDVTLTGRTVLWTQLLTEPINPLLGTGHQSFWLGERAERFWKMWNFRPNQAHNGYLETYLNGGLVGVSLLLLMLLSCAKRLKMEIQQNSGYAALCFSLLLISVFYNWTEAMFNKMSPIWLLLLMACLSPMRSTGTSRVGI